MNGNKIKGTLILRTLRGKLMPYWYLRYTNTSGRSDYHRLCEWKGTPPASGNAKDLGDDIFERSRMRALAELEKVRLKLNAQKSIEELEHNEYIVAKYNLKVKYGRKRSLDTVICRPPQKGDTFKVWESFVNSIGGMSCGEKQQAQTRMMAERFFEFVLSRQQAEKFPLESVSEGDIKAFLDYLERDLHLSPRTWNEYLITLQRIFKQLAEYSPVYKFLQNIKKRKLEEISRDIFTSQEIIEIEAMAEQMGELLIKSMVIIASCTGLRLKDICLLQWKSIDFRNNTISLKTFKTKGSVNLPMWPALSVELNRIKDTLPRKPSPNDYVLPEAAEQYNRNQNNLLDRLHRILKVLGYGTSDEKLIKWNKGLSANILNESPAKILKNVKAALDAPDCNWSELRKRNGLQFLKMYLDGMTIATLAQKAERSKGTISDYLNALEKLSGERIIRRPISTLLPADEIRGELRSEKPKSGRARSASLRGWHSFRGSFVMAALNEGANIETIKKVLGSKMVDIIMEHYIKATPQFLEKGLGQHVPIHALATVSAEPERAMIIATPLEQRVELVVRLLKQATSENWEKIRTEILEILGEKSTFIQ